uniref:Cytochrome b-c1 complex subunit 10 n=1 Tax=Parasteatoda tepidariorum TaxID=114398 RepID=A0A2L2Y056_PARTP
MLTRIIGKNRIAFVQSWSKTGATFGAAGGLGFLYFTDWKAVLKYLPVYNTKFQNSEK